LIPDIHIHDLKGVEIKKNAYLGLVLKTVIVYTPCS
jgi:hypothetical protein